MMAAIRQDNHGVELQQLFAGFADAASLPSLSVTGLTLDSRQVEPGWLFLACAGIRQHGVHFIEEAIVNGAVAVALEPAADAQGVELDRFNVPVFQVERLHGVASKVAARFYGDPSGQMKV
ncbi:MAG: Mur ligase domain-containing protein, partial [Gammaproteobacteria bacterium]|nr:Mur ligase domain-containing protein [Gammaproteobacteria bacterium]